MSFSGNTSAWALESILCVCKGFYNIILNHNAPMNWNISHKVFLNNFPLLSVPTICIQAGKTSSLPIVRGFYFLTTISIMFNDTKRVVSDHFSIMVEDAWMEVYVENTRLNACLVCEVPYTHLTYTAHQTFRYRLCSPCLSTQIRNLYILPLRHTPISLHSLISNFITLPSVTKLNYCWLRDR